MGQPWDAAGRPPRQRHRVINQMGTITHGVGTTFVNNSQSGCLCVALGSGCLAVLEEAALQIPVENVTLCSSHRCLLVIINSCSKERGPGERIQGCGGCHLPLTGHLSQSLPASLHRSTSQTEQIKRRGPGQTLQRMSGSRGNRSAPRQRPPALEGRGRTDGIAHDREVVLVWF